jgi:hypothetical protein
VWALNVDWLEGQLERLLSPQDWKLYKNKKDGKSFKELFIDRRPRQQFIGTATPRMLNQRLTVQQGVFLCQADVTKPWAYNLRRMSGTHRSAMTSFSMGRASMKEAFSELSAMNVTARSLFPGVDGYARSMAVRAYQLWKIPILAE